MSYKYNINKKNINLLSSLLDIKNIFQKSNSSIHKARNELKVVEFNGIKYVVKSFKVPHIINRIAYTFLRDGKAKKSYQNALKLHKLNVTTPEPIGVIEFFKMGLLSESYFISVFEPYDFTIREVFHHKAEDYQEILKQFAKFTYKIHQKGVWHVDYSLGNILITKTDDTYKFSLVDINRMEFKSINDYEGLKNLNKFWAKDENDLIHLAREYAIIAKLDEDKAIKIALNEAKSLEAKVNLKRRIRGQN
ncbi:MAG: serine/threonine protein kinase [Sulfurimonas sp.]